APPMNGRRSRAAATVRTHRPMWRTASLAWRKDVRRKEYAAGTAHTRHTSTAPRIEADDPASRVCSPMISHPALPVPPCQAWVGRLGRVLYCLCETPRPLLRLAIPRGAI